MKSRADHEPTEKPTPPRRQNPDITDPNTQELAQKMFWRTYQPVAQTLHMFQQDCCDTYLSFAPADELKLTELEDPKKFLQKIHQLVNECFKIAFQTKDPTERHQRQRQKSMYIHFHNNNYDPLVIPQRRSDKALTTDPVRLQNLIEDGAFLLQDKHEMAHWVEDMTVQLLEEANYIKPNQAEHIRQNLQECRRPHWRNILQDEGPQAAKAVAKALRSYQNRTSPSISNRL